VSDHDPYSDYALPFDYVSRSLLFGTASSSKGYCRPGGLSNFAPASPLVILSEAKNRLCPLRSPLSHIVIPSEVRFRQLLVNYAWTEKAWLPAA
jgi:hypothetical protein